VKQRRPSWRWLQLAGLLCLTPILVTAVVDLVSLAAPPTIGPRELVGRHAPIGPAAVRCDRVPDGYWKVRNGGALVQRVDFCRLGDRVLPVVSGADEPPDAPTVEGKLRWIPAFAGNGTWFEGLRQHNELNVRAYRVYLDRDEGSRPAIAIAVGACFAIIVGWRVWIGAFLRRRRAATA